MVSELHLHLDGSMRLNTLIGLTEQGKVNPDDFLKQIRFKQGMTQEECLKIFATTLSVMQTKEALRQISYEICEDQKKKGVDYVEIRYCPYLHRDNGLGIEDVINSVHRGLQMAEKDFGIKTAQIFCALRHESAEDSAALAGLACYYSKAKPEFNIVGFDLACAEANNAPWKHDKAFQIVQDAGLGLTIHAGEVEESLDYLRYAVSIGADRIGHGVLVADDERLIRQAREKGITIECCVTSNLHTGIIGSLAEHPAKRLFDEGIRIAFCADNMLLSNTDSKKEYRIARNILGFNDEEIRQCRQYSDEARFRK